MFRKLKKSFNNMLKPRIEKAKIKDINKKFDLKALTNKEPINSYFATKYVNPFYMTYPDDSEYKYSYIKVNEEINTDIISKLLGELNWRARSVGAYFAAIKNKPEFEDHIGNLLLRSEVCYAGHNYCLALASFASNKSVAYIKQYLDYYLLTPKLYFDQLSAMGAIFYLSEVLNQDYYSEYLPMWNEFVKDKQNWNLEDSIKGFKEEMETLNVYKFEFSY